MRTKLSLRGLGLEAIMIIAALIFVFPIYVFVVIAFKKPQDVVAAPLTPPTEPYLGNFVEAWQAASLGSAFGNSAVIASLSVALLIVFGSLAGYQLARRRTKLSYGLYLMFLLGLMIPLQLGMVPLYQFMRDANLLRTYTSLIIFHVGHQLPLTIFLYAGFVRALPRDYEEAAYVDGASRLKTYAMIVFPLLRPVTGTVIILNAIGIWNDFLTPMLYVGGSAQQTLPVSIFSFRGEFATRWGPIFAGMALAIVPIMIVYFMLQRSIIKGFASGLRG
ncbi:carbohydrate ABC transporter permease [Microlunatus sp. GCM10028923]|uniref:carbohydrate ABC transporter permease n=1 Tax=Microlunatus sp. GCM10028923 TaxID=3273400 RepID=UPI003619B51E